jgi:hypothetical protein
MTPFLTRLGIGHTRRRRTSCEQAAAYRRSRVCRTARAVGGLRPAAWRCAAGTDAPRSHGSHGLREQQCDLSVDDDLGAARMLRPWALHPFRARCGSQEGIRSAILTLLRATRGGG